MAPLPVVPGALQAFAVGGQRPLVLAAGEREISLAPED